MSLTAMTWAMKQAPIKKTKTAVRNRMVLTYLADRFNDDSRVCWPSLDLIAKELDTSKTTIQRSVKELEDQGLIRRANPSIIAHIPEHRRPTVWTLNLHMKREDMGSNVDTRGSNVDHPGVPTLEREGSNVDHQTQREPKEEPKGNPNTPLTPQGADGASAADEPDRFEEFYEVYDRKKKRPDAERAWSKAAKKVDPQTIIDAAQAFIAAQKVANKHPHFTPYPATWLNAESWNDEIDDPQPQSTARGFDNSPEAWGIPSGATSFQEAPISFGFDDYINHEEIS